MYAESRDRTCAGTTPLPPQGSPFDHSGIPAYLSILIADYKTSVRTRRSTDIDRGLSWARLPCFPHYDYTYHEEFHHENNKPVDLKQLRSRKMPLECYK